MDLANRAWAQGCQRGIARTRDAWTPLLRLRERSPCEARRVRARRTGPHPVRPGPNPGLAIRPLPQAGEVNLGNLSNRRRSALGAGRRRLGLFRRLVHHVVRRLLVVRGRRGGRRRGRAARRGRCAVGRRGHGAERQSHYSRGKNKRAESDHWQTPEGETLRTGRARPGFPGLRYTYAGRAQSRARGFVAKS